MTVLAATAVAALAAAPEKTIFAHYMGCFPLDKVGDPYPAKLKYDTGKYEDAIGGAFYNPPLLPRNYKADPVEAAALDIRRAIRAGLDGFAIDVFAGRERAIETTRYLFQAAEKYDLPFQITLCLDAQYRNPAAIKFILDEFGKSPKLARRNGKVMFFGYNTRDAEHYVREYFERLEAGKQIIPPNYKKDTGFRGLPQLERDTIDFPELKTLDDFWHTEAGFKAQFKPFAHYEKLYGQKMFFQFELSPVLRGFSEFRNYVGMDFFRAAIGTIGKDFGSLGSFLPSTHATPEQIIELAKIAREAGAEWGEALCYQYDNPHWSRVHVGRIGETMLHRWDMIEKTGATLLQFTTWNDYAENTILAPAWETRYVHSKLNAYFVKKWKEGKAPVLTDDQIYVIYHKYPAGAEKNSFPFQAARTIDIEKPIEVITLLKAPATVSLPGRNVSWNAPAGFGYYKVPGTPGKVEVALHRADKLVKELKCGEPIVERPFRPQSTPTCYSTDFMDEWRKDFGHTPPVSLQGYYEVSDDSKLPNWFRMVYFGRYGDFENLPKVDPNADADGDGISNYEEFLRGTDPTKRDDISYEKGFVWSLTDDLPKNLSFNPDRDAHRNPVWHYFAHGVTREQPFTPFRDIERRPGSEGWTISHQYPWYSRQEYPWGREPRDYTLPQCSLTQEWGKEGHRVVLRPTTQHGAAVGWQSPVAGAVKVSVLAEAGSTGKIEFRAMNNPTPLFAHEFRNPAELERSFELNVAKGDVVYILAPANAANQSVTLKKVCVKLE